MPHWTDQLPELGESFLDRAREIERTKDAAQRTLADAYRAEVRLWQDIAATGLWTRKQISDCLIRMDGMILPHLPERMPEGGKPD